MSVVEILPSDISAAYERVPVRVWSEAGLYAWALQVLPGTIHGTGLTASQILATMNRYDHTINPVTITVYGDTIFNSVYKKAVLERPEGPGGYADFDLSGVLKRAFFDKLESEGSIKDNDYRLWGRYLLSTGGAKTWIKQYIRQVQQYGFRRDLTTGSVAVLVTMPIRRYEKYPLNLASFNPTGGTPRAEVAGWYDDKRRSTYYIDRALQVGHFDTIILPQLNRITIMAPGDPVVVAASYDVINECTPDNPFYIRWINHLGGWDYKMFGNRQYVEDVVTDITSIQTPEIDGDEYHIQETIDLSAFRYVQVGESDLPLDEFNALRILSRSPRIEYWNEDAQKWYSIILRKETTIKSKTDDTTGSVEFVFQMPRIRVQF